MKSNGRRKFFAVLAAVAVLIALAIALIFCKVVSDELAFLNAYDEAATDCLAVLYHQEDVEEAKYRLRTYGSVRVSTEGLPANADLELVFYKRVDSLFFERRIIGYVVHKDGRPHSYLIVRDKKL